MSRAEEESAIPGQLRGKVGSGIGTASGIGPASGAAIVCAPWRTVLKKLSADFRGTGVHLPD